MLILLSSVSGLDKSRRTRLAKVLHGEHGDLVIHAGFPLEAVTDAKIDEAARDVQSTNPSLHHAARLVKERRVPVAAHVLAITCRRVNGDNEMANALGLIPVLTEEVRRLGGGATALTIENV